VIRDRHTSLAIQVFASSLSDPRARRPVDALRAVAYLLILLAVSLLSQIGKDLDRGLSDVLISFPGFLKVVWLGGLWLAVGWSVTLLIVAGFRERLHLTLEGIGAAVLAFGLVLLAARSLTSATGAVPLLHRDQCRATTPWDQLGGRSPANAYLIEVLIVSALMASLTCATSGPGPAPS
jgi:hypothetical protein